ncbi:hypothetical protein GJAV_G00122430 [Gymnothorax javanicus]|nr:hypothetical protein GJAV_G00122430 [Gymnothorax javanicus]
MMETVSVAGREIRGPSLPVPSLHLMVPPLRLHSAAMWQVLQRQDMLHYGKVEEFVSAVMEAFPELLNESQRTELILGLQFTPAAAARCKTDPALEVLFWDFLSRLDELLPVPDLKQTVAWLSSSPSALEDCVQSVSQADQLKALLWHHKATLPSITENCQLSSMSCHPSETVLDSAKLTNPNSQSESRTDSRKHLSPACPAEVTRREPVIGHSDCIGEEPRTGTHQCLETDGKHGYSMSREQKDVLLHMKEEELEDWERLTVKMEDEYGVSRGKEPWKEEEMEREEQREGCVTDQAVNTERLAEGRVKPENGGEEEEEASSLVNFCLQIEHRVWIPPLECSDSADTASLPPLTQSGSPLALPPTSWENGSGDVTKQRAAREATKARVQKHRQKIRSNPDLVEEYRRKERERYKKRKEKGLLKSVGELTAKQQKKLRAKWNENSKRYRQKKKCLQAILNDSPPSDVSGIDDQPL